MDYLETLGQEMAEEEAVAPTTRSVALAVMAALLAAAEAAEELLTIQPAAQAVQAAAAR